GCASRTRATTSATRPGGSTATSRIVLPSAGRRTAKAAGAAADAPSPAARRAGVAVPLSIALTVLPLGEPVEPAGERDDEDLAAAPAREVHGVGDVDARAPVAARAVEVGHEAPDLALVEVGVEVAAPEAGQGAAVDDEAAGDRAAAEGLAVRPRVRVLEDRRPVAGGARPAHVMAALVERPAEVRSPGAPQAQVIHLLEAVLADVRDRDPAPVEGEAEGVAQAHREDRVAPGAPDERVAARDRVGVPAAPVRVDAKQLAEQARPVLGVGAAGPAVAGGGEQVAAGPEGDRAAVVVGRPRVRDLEDLAPAVRPDPEVGGRAELVDLDVAVGVRVVGVEQVVAPVGGVEGDREESPLAVRRRAPADVEERAAAHVAVGEDPDAAGALGHVELSAHARGDGREGGLIEARDPVLDDLRLRGGSARRERQGGQQRQPADASPPPIAPAERHGPSS